MQGLARRPFVLTQYSSAFAAFCELFDLKIPADHRKHRNGQHSCFDKQVADFKYNDAYRSVKQNGHLNVEIGDTAFKRFENNLSMKNPRSENADASSRQYICWKVQSNNYSRERA